MLTAQLATAETPSLQRILTTLLRRVAILMFHINKQASMDTAPAVLLM